MFRFSLDNSIGGPAKIVESGALLEQKNLAAEP